MAKHKLNRPAAPIKGRTVEFHESSRRRSRADGVVPRGSSCEATIKVETDATVVPDVVYGYDFDATQNNSNDIEIDCTVFDNTKQAKAEAALRRQIYGSQPKNPSLRFSQLAWQKLLWFRDRGNTEIAGWGITRIDDPLLVVDFRTILQRTTSSSYIFDDDGLCESIESWRAEGLKPDQFNRISIHTHPGNSATPSTVDWNTYSDPHIQGSLPWLVMMILAKGGETSAMLRVSAEGGPTVCKSIPVNVLGSFMSIADEFPDLRFGDLKEEWEAEYLRNVHPIQTIKPSKQNKRLTVNDVADAVRQFTDRARVRKSSGSLLSGAEFDDEGFPLTDSDDSDSMSNDDFFRSRHGSDLGIYQ